MSPEMYFACINKLNMNKDIKKSDVYSLGLVLLQVKYLIDTKTFKNR